MWKLLLLVLVAVATAAGTGESPWSAGAALARLFQFGPRFQIACFLLSNEEAARLQAGGGLADRIASRRPSSSAARRPASSSASSELTCPRGVTYFDGCNSCSCGANQLCTLKACSKEDAVEIFDPCIGVTCGYHQRCQAICVGDVCRLRPLCVSDDAPVCTNCPWICVDERQDCGNRFDGSCRPTLACYRPNI